MGTYTERDTHTDNTERYSVYKKMDFILNCLYLVHILQGVQFKTEPGRTESLTALYFRIYCII